MMKNLYDNINLFCPGTNEFIFDFIYQLGYSDKDLKKLKGRKKIKKEVLEVLQYLIELDILSVKLWLHKPELNKKRISTNQTINEIDKVWFINARYPDFYNMVLFGVPDWYYKSLKKNGFSETMDWKTFVEEKIGNLEQWIENNKPKNTNYNTV